MADKHDVFRKLFGEGAIRAPLNMPSDFPGLASGISEIDDIFRNFIDQAEQMAFDATPDAHRCEYFFIRFFPTEEMIYDFPYIARDFLKHEYKNFDSYEFEEYLNEDCIYCDPGVDYVGWFLNMMLSAALQGSEYSLALFKNLYQTYYKKEYNQLKRFKEISVSEILSFLESDSISEFTADSVSTLPRVIMMCRLMGIKFTDNCSKLYVLINAFPKPADHSEYTYSGFSDRIVSESEEYIRGKIMEMSDKAKEKKEPEFFEAYNKMDAFLHEALKWSGLNERYVDYADDELPIIDDLLIRTLELMKKVNPKEEFTFDDIQRNALVLHCVNALSCLETYTKEYSYRILEIFPGMYEEDDEWCLFDQSKIKWIENSGTEKKKDSGEAKRTVLSKSSNTLPVSENGTDNNELIDEVERLRSQLRKTENALAHEKAKASKLEVELKETSQKLKASEEEHEELVHLRRHVYHLSEKTEKVTDEALSEMSSILTDKKIVIIGGHDNWIYKLRNKFKKWVFLKAEPNNTVDSQILMNADYIYFFTDHICHGTYLKYIKIIRDKGLPFGYIHSINLQSNIQQIYKDVCSTD